MFSSTFSPTALASICASRTFVNEIYVRRKFGTYILTYILEGLIDRWMIHTYKNIHIFAYIRRIHNYILTYIDKIHTYMRTYIHTYMHVEWMKKRTYNHTTKKKKGNVTDDDDDDDSTSSRSGAQVPPPK